MPRKKPEIITGTRLNEIKDELDITLYDYAWFLGLYSASYTRVVGDKAEHPVDHPIAGLARFLLLNFPDIPMPLDRMILTEHDRSANQLERLKESYLDAGAQISIGGHLLDLERPAHLSALIFRSKASVYQYASGRVSIILSVSHWLSIVQWAIEADQTDKIESVIADELKAHGRHKKADIEELLKFGW